MQRYHHKQAQAMLWVDRLPDPIHHQNYLRAVEPSARRPLGPVSIIVDGGRELGAGPHREPSGTSSLFVGLLRDQGENGHQDGLAVVPLRGHDRCSEVRFLTILCHSQTKITANWSHMQFFCILRYVVIHTVSSIVGTPLSSRRHQLSR